MIPVFHNAVGDPVGRGVVSVSTKAASGLSLFSGHGKIALALYGYQKIHARWPRTDA